MWVCEQFTILNVSVNCVSKHEIYLDLDEEYDEDAENENSANETDTGYPVNLDNILQRGKLEHLK